MTLLQFWGYKSLYTPRLSTPLRAYNLHAMHHVVKPTEIKKIK